MAHKKAGGTTTNGRDSISKRRGVKLFGGRKTKIGSIIIRQKGTKYSPGLNVGMGKDYTLFSEIDGIVKFQQKKVQLFNGRKVLKTVANVIPA